VQPRKPAARISRIFMVPAVCPSSYGLSVDVTWMNLDFSGDGSLQLTALVCMVRLAGFEPATCCSGGGFGPILETFTMVCCCL
jgi:hypothetical protein